MKIIHEYYKKTGNSIYIDQMIKTLHNQGFVVKQNIVFNVKAKTEESKQTKI